LRECRKKGGNVDKIDDHLKLEICDYVEICNFEKLSQKSANLKNFNDKSEIFPKIILHPNMRLIIFL